MREANRQEGRVQCHICSVCLQVPHGDGSLIPLPPHICLGHGTVGRGRRLKWVRLTQMEKKLPLGHCQMTNTHRKKGENVCVCVCVCICGQVRDVFRFWQISTACLSLETGWKKTQTSFEFKLGHTVLKKPRTEHELYRQQDYLKNIEYFLWLESGSILSFKT